MKEDNELEKAKAWWESKTADEKILLAKKHIKIYFGTPLDFEILLIHQKENPTPKQEHEIVMQQCESCQKEFDIDTMVNAEQYFCQTCYDELSQSPDFFPKQEREEELGSEKIEELYEASIVYTDSEITVYGKFQTYSDEEIKSYCKRDFIAGANWQKQKSESSINELVEAHKAEMKHVIDFLTNENSKYSIMYGNQEKRIATNENDYTIEEFIEIALSKHNK